jgi:hypothetical protein
MGAADPVMKTFGNEGFSMCGGIARSQRLLWEKAQ